MDTPDGNVIASCEFFTVEKLRLAPREEIGNRSAARFSIISVAEGSVKSPEGKIFGKGSFFLLPRGDTKLIAISLSTLLRTTIP